MRLLIEILTSTFQKIACITIIYYFSWSNTNKSKTYSIFENLTIGIEFMQSIWAQLLFIPFIFTIIPLSQGQ